MESIQQEDVPPNLSNLVKVPLGRWQLFLREKPDFEIDGQPFVALTVMLHPETHEYIWRALGRIVESGQVSSYREFWDRCHKFFNKETPCLGLNPPDAQFPLSCQFSSKCSIMIPKSSESTACKACLQAAEDPVQVWREIRNVAEDVIYDGGVKTLEALNQSQAKVWPCPMCSVEVPLTDIKCHLEKSHFFSHFVCFHCDDQFVDAMDLSLHTYQEHPEIQELCCPLCPANVPIDGESDELDNHFRQCRKNKNIALSQEMAELFECQLCYLRFPTKTMYVSHFAACLAATLRTESVHGKNIQMVELENVSSLSTLKSSLQSQDNQLELSKVTCQVCSKMIVAKFLTRHLMVRHSIGDFKCTSCPLIFLSAKELIDHSYDAHSSQEKEVCPNCWKKIERPRLVRHVETCHKIIFWTARTSKRFRYKGFICPDCGSIFFDQTKLDQHESQECNRQINVSEVMFGHKSSQRTEAFQSTNHKDRPLSEEILKCRLCFQKCKNLRDLADHLEDVCEARVRNSKTALSSVVPIFRNGDKPKETPVVVPQRLSSSDKIECHVCCRQISIETLAKYKLRHQLGQFNCPKCPLNFVTAEDVLKHVLTHPDVHELHCPNCNQDVDLGPNHEDFVNHMATCYRLKFRLDETSQKHIQEIDRECVNCGQRYAALSLIVCDICDEKVMGVEKLKKHKSHHNSPSALCFNCGKESSQNFQLKSLLKQCHSSYKKVMCTDKYKCDLCGKEFKRPCILRTHMNNSHPTSAKFSCQDCGFIGGGPYGLKRHQATHEPPKYGCPICGKRFIRQRALRCHVNTHTGKKPYKCNLCDFESAAQTNVHRHKRRVHQNQSKRKKENRLKELGSKS